MEKEQKSQIVPLSDEDAVKEIIVDSIFNLWKVVNNLTKLRPTKKGNFRVTIFGSARAKPGSFVYTQVKEVAKALTLMDCDIITGGGPGIMQAANEGSAEVNSNKTRSLGIRVDLPFEQEVNPFVKEAFEHGTFFTRLHHFVLVSDAFIIAPGGIGTVLESMMIWQLLQVRHIKGVPLIFVGKMWKDLVKWAHLHLLENQLVNPEDLEIPICVDTADEVIAILQKHHAEWKSQQNH